MATLPSERRRRLRTSLKWAALLILIALVVSFRLVEEIGVDQAPADRYIVKTILDGDTMELRGGDRLRLLAIDTPEKGDPLYDSACRFLERLVLGKPVRIEFAGRRRDKYGRLLGYAYVDSLFVNKAIVRQGLGYVYLFRDQELLRPEVSRILQAQRQALRDSIGLWGLRRVPEEYYIAAAGSFRFHRTGCRHVRNWTPGQVRTFESREAALYEGLSPCRSCKP
ncbi:MAG: thermonuclease family protein [Candidatus Zixiibacteriota bacterium]